MLLNSRDWTITGVLNAIIRLAKTKVKTYPCTIGTRVFIFSKKTFIFVESEPLTDVSMFSKA